MDNYRYKAMIKAHFYAVQNLTREKQRFANYLFMKCYGLAQEKILSQNTGTTTIALMEQFETVNDLTYMDELYFPITTSRHWCPNGSRDTCLC